MSKLNISCQENNTLLGKKIKSDAFELDEEQKAEKKVKSEETKKNKKFLYFISDLDESFNKEKTPSQEKLSGNELSIQYRLKKSVEILQSNYDFEHIKQSLDYDNTNKTTIYRLRNIILIKRIKISMKNLFINTNIALQKNLKYLKE